MAYRRSLRFDNAKGILIILVVVGHFLLPVEGNSTACSNLFYLIYAFHMAAFTFISGMFSENMIKSESGKIIFNWRRFIRILILYVFFKIITFFSEIPAYGKTSEYPDLLRESGAPWYLLALLIWYLFIPVVYYFKNIYLFFGSGKEQIKRGRSGDRSRRSGRRPVSISCGFLLWLLILFMSLAGGYLSWMKDFLSLDRVISFAPFFYAGFLIGPERMDSNVLKKNGAVSSRLLTANLFITTLSVLTIIFFMDDLLWQYRYVVYGTLLYQEPYTT